MDLLKNERQSWIEGSREKPLDEIRGLESFMSIVSYIDDEDKNSQFIKKVTLDKLSSFVSDSTSFCDIASNIINKDLNKKFVKAVTMKKLASFVKGIYSFISIYSSFKDKVEKSQFIKKVTYEKLASSICYSSAFKDIALNLTDEENENLVEALTIDKLLSLVTNSIESFIDIASNLKNERQGKKFLAQIGFERLQRWMMTNEDYFKKIAEIFIVLYSTELLESAFRNSEDFSLSSLIGYDIEKVSILNPEQNSLNASSKLDFKNESFSAILFSYVLKKEDRPLPFVPRTFSYKLNLT